MPMTLTTDQEKALDTLHMGKNSLILGAAGSGKSFIIDDFCASMESKGHKVLRTATTGIAAERINGRTVHNVLHLNAFISPNNHEMEFFTHELANADILVIDEISMLHPIYIKALVKIISSLDHPVQLIVSGDFLQLPTVPIPGESFMRYAFQSPYWRDLNLTPCMMEQIVRQSDAVDQKILNGVRFGSADTMGELLATSSLHYLDKEITVCATRELVREKNLAEIDKLPGPAYRFQGETDPKGVSIDTSGLPIEEIFYVKNGMRVMAVINSPDDHYHNGTMGTVIGIDEPAKVCRVFFDSGYTEDIRPYVFETTAKSKMDDRTIHFSQFPIRPAYAVTVHKSQGATYDAVNICLDKCWDPGQLYVAISRCKSISNMYFERPVPLNYLKTDPRVIQFYAELKKQEEENWRPRYYILSAA